MLTFVIPARSQREMTAECLASTLGSVRQLGLDSIADFVLLDDNSEPADGINDLFRAFRQQSGRPTAIYRFKQRQHYSRILAHALSFAQGENVFFISNDMVVTPHWMRTLLSVAALDRTFGIIRGTAQIVDSHPEHQFIPPFPLRSSDDIVNFSAYMAQTVGLLHEEDQLLSGDAVLVRRALIDAIGVGDTRYYAYFGDIDYGLRAQRAGFKLVCASGAWLEHRGQGYVKAEAAQSKATMEQQHTKRMATVQDAYLMFRQKWDPTLPEKYAGTQDWNFDRLRTLTRPKGWDYIAPIKAEAAAVEKL